MSVLDDITNRIAPIKSDHVSKGKQSAKPKNQQSSLMITIPLDPDAEGPLVLEAEPGWKLFHHMDKSIDIIWTNSKQPGRRIDVTSMSVQHGTLLSSNTEPVNLALHTPFIRLPSDVYDFLVDVAKPTPFSMGRGMEPVELVNCNMTAALPNIVLNLEGGAQQLVVKPQQYVLNVGQNLGGPFSGKCVLLAKNGGGGELEIGYAAFRGRSVWFDWANARTGFQV